MKLVYKKINDFKAIYSFLKIVGERIPYFFDTEYELWEEGFVNDADSDGEEMFAELEVHAAYSDETLVGFIQFGIPRFIYGENGKEYREDCGVIRGLYFYDEIDCGEELINLAEEYFKAKNVTRKFAFYHALGMTCYAWHGKLFSGQQHVEAALLKRGFEIEHENVYFSRLLNENDALYSDTTELIFGKTSSKGVCEFSIRVDSERVGAGELVYLPQGGICYLKWIFVFEQFKRNGYSTSALRELFAELYKKGIRRIDTDTADNNEAARGLYNKLGFTDMGRTRSYILLNK